MARPNKLYSKPRVTSIAADDLLTTGQLQADGTYKVKTITKEDARAELLAPVEITYLGLVALSGSYDTEVSYKITNATAANFNLIVKAVSATAIGCEAKDPLYPNDKVMYNFASDVITWRWDTVNDISAGVDFRNSNEVSIGATGCSNITIGTSPSSITIENNCTNITIGNDCVDITISATSSNINVKNAVQTLANTSDLAFYDDVSVEKDIRISADGGNLLTYIGGSGWVITPIV